VETILNRNPYVSYYYHNDHLATPQKLTDGTGAVVWSADYKPFGEATITVSTITNNLRFPGQYYDAETGNHYNYFRDYDPVVGRYLQADPIGIVEGENHSYVYAYNNPLGYYDPDGQIAWAAALLPCIKGAMIGAVVDVVVQKCECCYKQFGWEIWKCNLKECPPINKCSVAVSAVVGCAAGYLPGAPPTTIAGLKIILKKVGAKAILKFLGKLGC
jgi:RHS repeat-associated protein